MSQSFTSVKGFMGAVNRGIPKVTEAKQRHILTYAMKHCEGIAKQRARAYGGRSFWRDIANSIGSQLTSNSTAVVYTTHHAAAHKEKGGKVSAPGKKPMSKSVLTGKPRRFLTIPLPWCPRNKRDMDAWPRDSWRIFSGRDGRWWAGVQTLKGGKETTRILWRLVTSVTHRAFPFWVKEADAAMAISLAMTKYVKPKP
jgi:hypothetical protein